MWEWAGEHPILFTILGLWTVLITGLVVEELLMILHHAVARGHVERAEAIAMPQETRDMLADGVANEMCDWHKAWTKAHPIGPGMMIPNCSNDGCDFSRFG